jgi:hypothetical protein
MAEKTVKTRIQHKRGTSTDWTSATNFKPLDGELIVYKPSTAGGNAKLKVGDGNTLVQSLPFVEAVPSSHTHTNYENQNAFSKIQVGTNASNTVEANNTSSTLQLVAGSNITINTDTANRKITVSATDINTTYDLAASKNSVNGNVKLNLTAGGSGSGTDSVTIKGDGATTVTTDNNGNIIIRSTDTTYSAGSGITLDGTTFSNSGVRAIAIGTTNGTISVNTNGTSADVKIKGLGTAAYTDSTAYAASSHSHAEYALATNIPTVNNGTLTIQKNGTNITTFTANQSGSATANITVPTKVSELTNDSGFITSFTNTTYTFASGDSNGQIKVTPSSGTAQNISVKGLGSAAYTNSTAYASASHSHSGYLKFVNFKDGVLELASVT